jgi:hypothetical protein
MSRLVIYPSNGGSNITWREIAEINTGKGETITFKLKSGIAVTVSRQTDWVLVENEEE